MRNELLGYLVDALEPRERAAVESSLSDDPGLRADLESLRRGIEPLAPDKAHFEPTPGLAGRACAFVAERGREVAPAASKAGRFGTWRLQDLIVAAGIAVAATILFFPAIYQSRITSNRLACQDNLRQVGIALTQYSDTFGGEFPFVAQQGPFAVAGIYAPRLVEAGLVDDSRWFVCPESALAEGGAFVVPATIDLAKADSDQLAALQRTMGGSYGYAMGHLEEGVYRGTKNLRRPYFALVADSPIRDKGQFRSANHGQTGQNVLIEDGRVVFVTLCLLDNGSDNFFLNDRGAVGAGIHSEDSVIGASNAAPIVTVALGQ